MPIFLQLLGANLFILWIFGKILGNKIHQILMPPYGDLFLQYSWILAAIGIPLVLLAQIIKLKKRKEKCINQLASQTNKQLSELQSPEHQSSEYKSSEYKTSEKKDFYTESQKYCGLKSSEKDTKHNSTLKDLALKVDWTPLSGGGSNFKSSGLHKITDYRILIKSSSCMKLFAGFFIAIGLFIPGAMAYMDYRDQGLEWSLLFPLLGCLIFVAVGIAMMFFPRPRYIDKRLGWFWAGTKNPQGEQAFRQLANASPLKDLVALQIISEYISGKNGSYTSWELNIIDKDAKRYNLLDHGDKFSLINDAETIATFLSIPIWDNT